ncbi:MAG: HAD family hydrolase [Clostridiales bacterium]|nr:HAD family hydrolase [Clostridiales bacterium]
MLKVVLFDIGGTLHTVHNNHALRVAFAQRLITRLADYDIHLNTTAELLAALLYANAERYKHWSESSRVELPQARIWNEYYLRAFHIGEEWLAPIAEELSFLYDYARVRNLRRPRVLETMQELSDMGLRLGIISNIISTSFVPQVLREYGIEKYMECVVMSSEAGWRKPDARIFEIAMEQLGVRAEEVAYVGDTISRDVLGARNAGLALMIQIRNPAIAHRDAKFRENAPTPDYLIDELNEIPDLIHAYMI